MYVAEWGHLTSTTESDSRLLRNLGAANPGHFEDVTQAAGVSIENPDGVCGGEV